MISPEQEKEDYESLKELLEYLAPDIIGKKLMDYFWQLSGKFAAPGILGGIGGSFTVGVMGNGGGSGINAQGGYGGAGGGGGQAIAIGGGANGHTTIGPGGLGTFTNVGNGGGYSNNGGGGAGIPFVTNAITIVQGGTSAVQLPTNPISGQQYTIVNHTHQLLTVFANSQSTYYGDIT